MDFKIKNLYITTAVISVNTGEASAFMENIINVFVSGLCIAGNSFIKEKEF